MIRKKASFPFVLLALLIALDCYADDLAGALGVPSELIFEPSSGVIGAFVVLWVLLLVLAFLALRLMYRHLRPVGWMRAGYLLLCAYGLAIAVGNNAVRIALLAKEGVVSQPTTPAIFFVGTYVTRLSVYAAIATTCAVLLLAVGRKDLSRRSRLGSCLLLAALAAAAASFLAGGAETLMASPYWEGGSILHGTLYMGTFPREYPALVEPWATIAFLVGTSLVTIGLLKARLESSTLLPPLAMAGAILVQVLPRIGRGLVTETLYGADFYYAFRLDRSLAFPLFPLLILSLAILCLRVSRGKTQGPGREIGNT